MIYNNSEEAIRHNLALNFEWFELDFDWVGGDLLTDAGRAAVTSDRTGSYYSAKDENLASSEKMENTKSLTLPDIKRLMEEFPKMKVCTDVKSHNVAALALMKSELPEVFADRVVAQIYQPEEYGPVREMGFNNIIWTMYKYSGTDAQALSSLTLMSLTCVTMPQARAESGFARVCREAGERVMTHTVNDPELLERLRRECSVDEVYSDFLRPEEGGGSG